MPLEINGVAYMTVPDLLDDMQITRQTLWRWRHDGRIPLGRRFRSRQLIFSMDEAALIRNYANRIELIIAPESSAQLSLFSDSKVHQSVDDKPTREFSQ